MKHVYCSTFSQFVPLSMGRDHSAICIHHSQLFITVIPQCFFNVRAYFSSPNQHGAGDTDTETKIEIERDNEMGHSEGRGIIYFSLMMFQARSRWSANCILQVSAPVSPSATIMSGLCERKIKSLALLSVAK